MTKIDPPPVATLLTGLETHSHYTGSFTMPFPLSQPQRPRSGAGTPQFRQYARDAWILDCHGVWGISMVHQEECLRCGTLERDGHSQGDGS